MRKFKRWPACGPGRVVIVVAGAALIGLNLSPATSVADQADGRKESSVIDSAQAPGNQLLSLVNQVNQAFRLRASQIISLQLDPTPDFPISTPITIDGQMHQLDLVPHSVRATGYQLLAQVADGSMVNVDPGPVGTLRGSLADVPGSAAAASLLEDGLHGVIRMPDGTRWWFEPMAPRIAGATPDQHVLYRGTDAVPGGGVCGVDDVGMKLPLADPRGGAEGGIAGGALECAQLGIDADFEYYVDHGSSVANVQNQITMVINTVNVQYETEVNIHHEITTIIVRTAEIDPYTTTSPNGLLNELRTEWNNNQSGVQRDLAELFTGKNLDGSVIGIAYLGVVCNLDLAYSVVQSDCCGGMSCQSDLSAHELGHNWNAAHCSCPSNTMNPSLTCTNVHAAVSIDQIVSFRDSVACLSPCENGYATLPFFDDFPTTTIDASKWTGIGGAQSETLGINEPSPPDSCNLDGNTLGGDQIRSALISTAGIGILTLDYKYERKGGGDQPEPGDDLVVEYLNSSGQWMEVQRQFGAGPAMTNYAAAPTIAFPNDALHIGFRFRFRAISNEPGTDDWFVDDVSLVGLAAPSNNHCGNATYVAAGSHPFTTVSATTDGPVEQACNFNGSNQITNDVWFLFPAECTGEATFTLCGATFDSKMAIYGSECPGSTSGNAIACNDNSCGDDAQITLPVYAGQLLRVRVGGVNGATGSGNLVITCVAPTPPCPADINDDGAVNTADLLAVIGAWGPCAGCAADINADGAVNVADLLAAISTWGQCP